MHPVREVPTGIVAEVHPARYLLRAKDLVDAPNFRWLAVSPVGQPETSIVLMAIPGAPVMDNHTADDVRSLMARGFAGTIFLTTEDCRASFEQRRARGVECARGARPSGFVLHT